MKLSAPIHRLKRKAKLVSREKNIPLHEALDQIAVSEGYASWSLLSAKRSDAGPARELFSSLNPGELLLVGARPGQGKTLMSLRLAVEAMLSGNHCVFFTLEYSERQIRDRFAAIGADWARFEHLFSFDTSDEISAGYLQRRLSSAPRGTLVVVDYLQILDQDRRKPELSDQIRSLKGFARERGLIIVFISQIDRSYDPAAKRFPGLEDIRLPNPLDLRQFSKACFLSNGDVDMRAIGGTRETG